MTNKRRRRLRRLVNRSARKWSRRYGLFTAAGWREHQTLWTEGGPWSAGVAEAQMMRRS